MDEKKYTELANGMGIAAQKALEFIEKIIAAPIMEGTGIFTDKVKFWRFKNQVEIITKARDYLKEKGIKIPKKIPIKDVTTLLEYASFEDEEIMQSCWANLLSNTLNPNNQFDSCHVFSQILNQISVNEIHLLNFALLKSFISSSDDRPYFERNILIRESNAEYQTGILLVDNLLRLRLIEEKPPQLINSSRKTYLYDDEDEPENEIIASSSYRLSRFGAELMKQIKE